MSRDPQQASQLFSQIDITAGTQGDNASEIREHESEQIDLLHQILAALDRNNDLLEDIAASALANQRQRGDELQKWRQANPGLAQSCRHAAESLARVQAEFLQNLTNEVEENSEAMEEGEFVFNEFVDRFGPRLAHLNGVLQMLSQLSQGGTEAPRQD
ncbi:MAG: hypothetical protein VX970_04185 [Planctomycetota bacterium]|nr:hypothetical protein [Planctomycetota bacterium]MEC8336652.1 hypothetical protein [Planctomycetota bacterium]